MMLDTIKYSGIYAKTAALNATLLKHDDYYKLASRETVKEFAEALSEIPTYKESAAEAIAFGASRVAIERSLLTSLYRDFAALYGFVTDPGARKYLDVIFLQYILEIVKRNIRRIYDNRNVRGINPEYGKFMLAHTGIDLEKIAASDDINALYESVSGSEIHGVISQLNHETATLFDYEMVIDIYSVMKRIKYQEFLKEPALTPSRRLNGEETDLRNISWVYRAKTYYQIPKEKLFTYLTPANYKLSADIIKELAAAEDTEGFFAVIGKTHYKNVLNAEAPDMIDRDLRRYINAQYRKYARTFSLMSVVSHLYFKRQEINNLTTLIECVRYKRSPENSLARLSL